MIPSWAHDVKPEDITNATMLDLAELLGTENMLTLVESYSGMIIYPQSAIDRAQDHIQRLSRQSPKMPFRFRIASA